ncbi:MAG: acyl-CoA dehydrogenase [Bradymonadales bacterium]|nr:acyl-CoA dehydrogenase [Bradymonadales bacterium]
MADYKVNLRDIRFLLFEQLDLERLLQLEAFRDFTREDFDIVLMEAAKMAENTIAPTNKIGDQTGVSLKDGKVTVPPEVHAAYQLFQQGGWVSPSGSVEYGGQGLPSCVGLASNEMFTAASLSFTICPGLTAAAADLLQTSGTDQMKQLYCEKLNTGLWGGTMCLTEPQAGSAVGDLRCTAEPDGDHFKISGNKNFISSGDHDLTENIIHLVLARIKGAPKGMKGVSLFLVPKYRVNPGGTLGEFNDVHVGSIEHKMGIKASPTCEMNFGPNDDCWGWMIGEEGRGIRYMFQMMNEARIGVGMQGCSAASAAYHSALEYARERIQGVDITQMRDVDAPRVPIIQHPDVRRMLLMMKAYVEGMRGLLYQTAYYADLARFSPDQSKAEKYEGLVSFLTPICKAYCSDYGFRMTELAIQVLGGYGYCSEYPVEQYLRDCKVASIYEGTNGIQALDLLGRKIGGKGGMLFMGFVLRLNQFIDKHRKHELLAPQVKVLEEAKNTLAETVMALGSRTRKGDILYSIQHATPLLDMFGEVILAQILIEQAAIAYPKLAALNQEAGAADEASRRALQESNEEAKFYAGKLHNAAFFCSQVLPHVKARAVAMSSGDRSVLDVVL